MHKYNKTQLEKFKKYKRIDVMNMEGEKWVQLAYDSDPKKG